LKGGEVTLKQVQSQTKRLNSRDINMILK
jgi:hypothetical protein